MLPGIFGNTRGSPAPNMSPAWHCFAKHAFGTSGVRQSGGWCRHPHQVASDTTGSTGSAKRTPTLQISSGRFFLALIQPCQWSFGHQPIVEKVETHPECIYSITSRMTRVFKRRFAICSSLRQNAHQSVAWPKISAWWRTIANHAKIP